MLTAEQRALLGCGEFHGRDCVVESIEVANTEARIVFLDFGGTAQEPVRILLSARGEPLPPTPGAAISFDLQLARLGLAAPEDLRGIDPGEAAPRLPLRPEGCSFRRPGRCNEARGIWFPTSTSPTPGIPEPGAALLFAAGFGLIAAASPGRSGA